MRKGITSSVFILLFAMVTGSVFAGDNSACNEFKKNKNYKGAYGLCVAYQNSDQAGKDKIFDNWMKKFGPDAPVLPNSPNDVDGPITPTKLVCPCTEGMDTSAWGMAVGCPVNENGMMGMFVVPETNFTTFLTVSALDDSSYACELMQSPSTQVTKGDFSYAEFDACMSQLEDLCF